ncbi:MAG: copper amine oxidase N-terminal domain-containing protein [Ruminococcaceae bacterium]|nr:copper amine oxidase N-terminal domain-containing protein [Oscillospiraceae bacterium]
MKKVVTLLLAMVMIFTATASLAADIKVLVNGEAVEFDRQPVLDGETVMIPLRFVAEKLGAIVNWQGETQTIFTSCGDVLTTIQIGNNKMFLNDEEVLLDNAPILSTDRTLVNNVVLEKGLGATVNWDKETSTVTIEK